MKAEAALIDRLRDGDRFAFREFMDGYQKQVYFMALDLTGNHQDAEDLTQDVFIKAYRSIDKFRGDSKLSTWLYRITVNGYLDTYRKKSFKIFNVVERAPDNQRIVDESIEQNFDVDPERKTEAALIQQHIAHALKKLSGREKSVFVLRHYQDLKLKEISGIMKIAEGSVKSLLFRAIKKLQKELEFYRKEFGLED